MINFPIVKIKTEQEVDNHICVRIKGYNVCTCSFEYICKKCGKLNQVQSSFEVKRRLLVGCHFCCSKKNKIPIKTNLNPSRQNPKGKKAIGNRGEHYVAGLLIAKGYKVYIGYTTNEEGLDLVIKKGKKGKHIDIQVKASDIDHNDYPSNNGFQAFSGSPSDIDFDFLIVIMLNYDTIWIVPKKDLQTVFLSPNNYKPKEEWICNFKANWKHKDNPLDRKFPYQDAWHRIEKAFK